MNGTEGDYKTLEKEMSKKGPTDKFPKATGKGIDAEADVKKKDEAIYKNSVKDE